MGEGCVPRIDFVGLLSLLPLFGTKKTSKLRKKYSFRQVELRCRVLAMALCLGVSAWSQTHVQEVKGKLSNGLTYIIRNNEKPAQKLEARLIYSIGSCVEKEEERGYAHFLEHLAFSGTKHFPNQGLIAYVESLGSRYGIGLNAYTGYDRTIYMMSLPTDAPHMLDSTLLILRDWLGDISFDSASVERERSIVKEEIRNYVQDDSFYDLKIGKGIHAHRLPIGRMKDIDALCELHLQSFYRHWYQPRFATVLLVGDVDAFQAERQIQTLFGDLKNTHSLSPDLQAPLIYASGIELRTERDSLRTNVELDFIVPHRATIGNLIEQGRRYMLLQAVRNRLEGQDYKIDVANAWYLGGTEHFSLTCSGKSKDMVLNQLRVGIGTLNALATGEYDLNRQELLDLADHACNKLESFKMRSMTSSEWCDYYVDGVLLGEVTPADSIDFEAIAHRLQQTTAAELATMAKQLIDLLNESILVGYKMNPTQDETLSKDDVTHAIAEGLSASCPPYDYRPRKTETKTTQAIPTLLQMPLPNRESVNTSPVRKQYYPRMDITQYDFSNGVQLLLKPLPELTDSVVRIFIGVPGGAASVPDSLETRLGAVESYAELGGLEGMVQDSLEQFMLEHNVSLSLMPARNQRGIMASGTSGVLKELFGLLYRKTQRPERAYKDFAEVKNEMSERVGKSSTLERMIARSPNHLMELYIDSLMQGNLLLREPRTRDEIETLDLDQMMDYYTDCFSRTNGMRVVVLGQFRPDEVLEAMAQTFAGLPGKAAISWVERKKPDAANSWTIEANDDKSQTTLFTLLYGSYQGDFRADLQLRLLCELLRVRMVKYMRTQTGLVYTPYITLKYRNRPKPFAYFQLETAVDSERVGEAELCLSKLIDELIEHPAPLDELVDIKRSFLVNKREILTGDNLNGWSELLNNMDVPQVAAEMERYEETLQDISPEELRQTFAQFLRQGHTRTTLYIK